MNILSQLLSAEDIRLDWDIASKEHLFDAVAQRFERRYGVDSALTCRSLLAREELGSTALGHGVAIPHARIPGLAQELGVLVRTQFAIPFDSPDGKPVSMQLVLLVPEHANQAHLELLATAASMFSDKAFREQFKLAADASTVLQLMNTWTPPR